MAEEPEIEWYFCNDCGQKTKHFVRGKYSTTRAYADGTDFNQQALIIECCGCEHMAFVRRTHFSEHIDFDQDPVTGQVRMNALWDEAIYPPVTSRDAPLWFDDLPDSTLRLVSQEIYKSLQADSHFLATFGSRTLVDRLIVLTVGDQGNFPKGLSALQQQGMLSQHEREIIEPTLEAGNAAAHRGWAPTKDQLNTILDTVEGLIHRLLVLPKLAEELDEAVPSRGAATPPKIATQLSVSEKIKTAPAPLRKIYEELAEYLQGLGSDVTIHPQKHYVAFRRKRNFASVQVYNKKKQLRLYLNIDPEIVDLSRSNLRDVRRIGHYGTGDLEVLITKTKDIEDTRDLLDLSYIAS